MKKINGLKYSIILVAWRLPYIHAFQVEATNAHIDDFELKEEAVNVCSAGERHEVDFLQEHKLRLKFMHRRSLADFRAECFAWCTEDGAMPAGSSETNFSLPEEENVVVLVERPDNPTHLAPTKIYRLNFVEDFRHQFKQSAPHREDSTCDAH